MKKTSKHITSQEQLLQARDKNLAQIEKGALKAHGKLLGMDIFSWQNPMIYEVENILNSFPAPVLWFANAKDIAELLNENTSCLLNVKMICCYDKADSFFSLEIMNQIETFFGANQIDDALKMLQTFKKENGILLFTSKGNNWKKDMETFESFLDIHQNK